jgi:acyl-CoA oxidase
VGKSCNHAVVMAKLIIDGNDHGIQAFVVQLRSLEDHKTLPGKILNEKLNLS